MGTIEIFDYRICHVYFGAQLCLLQCVLQVYLEFPEFLSRLFCPLLSVGMPRFHIPTMPLDGDSFSPSISSDKSSKSELFFMIINRASLTSS